jgi:hypothetical protein
MAADRHLAAAPDTRLLVGRWLAMDAGERLDGSLHGGA